MQIQVKDLTSEWLKLSELKDFDWLSDVLAGSQGRPAPSTGLSVSLEVCKSAGNVLVRGRLGASILLVCSRCASEWLEPMSFPFDLVMAPAKPGAEPAELELTEEDFKLLYYRGDVIDLDESLRDEVILQLPDYPLCRADCRGLCQRCGEDLNRGLCACPPAAEVDPRLASLKLKLVK
jgi:uncharacterized protein